MAAKIPRMFADGLLRIVDGTATPNAIELAFVRSGFSIKEGGTEVKVLRNRETISFLAYGQEQETEISVTVDFIERNKETGDTDPSIVEALTQTGGALTWTSTRSDGAGVYCVDLQWIVANRDTTGTIETITARECYLVAGSVTITEGDVNSLSFTVRSPYSVTTSVRS